MSWKSFITAGLLCILASPVFAASAVPQLEIINDGLDASGNWVWYVRVAPSDGARTNSSGPTTGSPMAVELGLKALGVSQLVSVQNVGFDNTTGNLWDTDTPGKTIFGWEEKYQIIDPNTLVPTGTTAPEGIEVYCGTSCGQLTLTNNANRPSGAGNNHPTTADTTLGSGTSPNGERTELFVALGSNTLNSANTSTTYTLNYPKLMHSLSGPDTNLTQIGQSNNVLKITTVGPVAPLATSTPSASLQLLGSHGTGNNEGRIAEITSGTQGTNYKGFTGTASIQVKPGDINLDGKVDVLDLGLLASNLDLAGTKGWGQGDFNGTTGGTGEVNVLDLGILASNLDTTGGTYTALVANGVSDPAAGASLASGGLEGASVPEPASIALLGLAMIGGLGLMRRRA